MRIYFLTNRNKISSSTTDPFGNEISGDVKYRFGWAEAQRTKADHFRDPDNAYRLVAGATKIAGALPGPRNGLPDWDAPDVLVLIHGFASSFPVAIERAAQVRELYFGPRKVLPIAISWPTDGRVIDLHRIPARLKYFNDQRDARNSAESMAAILRDLLAALGRPLEGGPQPGAPRIHLVVHSMGNDALGHALVELRRQAKNRPFSVGVIENAFLSCADIEANALAPGRRLEQLRHLARSVHVYAAGDDQALRWSAGLNGGTARLGSGGPPVGIGGRVNYISCYGVSDTIFGHVLHQYYRCRLEVVRDCAAVIARKPTPWRVPIGTYPNSFRLKPEPALVSMATALSVKAMIEADPLIV